MKEVTMTREKAYQIIEKSKLDLSYAGLETIPVKTVEIEQFEVSPSINDEPGKVVTLLGLLRSRDELRFCEGDFICASFMIRDHHDFWFRDFFREAMEVIEALRVINGYDGHIIK